MTTTNEQIIRTTAVTIRLLAPNIIENCIHDNIKLEVADLLEIKRMNTQMAGGRPYGVLVDPGAKATISKEGRYLSASKAYKQQTKAVALIKHSAHHSTIFQFYVKLNKPKTDIQIFSDRDIALEWLKAQLEE